MTGAANQPDYLATLETARRLFPETRSVIVVSRIGEVELENIKAVQAELENSELAEQLKIAYWIGLPAASLCERASRLEAGTVILYLTQLRNQDGTLSINSVDVACKLGQSAAVPVFGLDTLVGTAVLGGCLGKTELSAQRAGAIAVNLTDRELPSHSSDSATRMDRSDSAWRQLRRSEIRDLNLPPGTVIAFRVPTLWERNRATIMAGLAAICLQAITILGLLVSRSKRLRVEKSLVESRNEAKRLTGRVLANQEEELKTLARELHDDFSQRLAANAISIGGIEQPLIPADPVRRELATIRERLVDLSKDMHRVSRQLHPSILEELGLADAIRSECHYWEELSTTKFSVSCGKLPSGISDDVVLCLFRVAQEAIRNAAKYADANLVELDLSADSEMIHLQVQDDGCGFDVAITPYQPGLGLASMRERVFFAGGRIRIESAEGKGTVICVKIPRSEP